MYLESVLSSSLSYLSMDSLLGRVCFFFPGFLFQLLSKGVKIILSQQRSSAYKDALKTLSPGNSAQCIV